MPYQAADPQVDTQPHGAAMGPLVSQQILYSRYKPGAVIWKKTGMDGFEPLLNRHIK